jgi:RHS repeat-associated protein
MKVNVNKIYVTIMAVLTLPPFLAQAQDTSRNYVRTVTMLNAGGTDSVQAVQYYNGLGWPTLSVATAGADGGTACTLTTYDALGRELRKYVPVPGSGLDYMTESTVSSAGYGFYHDNGGFSENHYDALDRVTSVEIAGDAWIQAGRQDRTAYLANTVFDEVLHYEAPENGTYSLTLPENTSFLYYPEGSLQKTVSWDADSVCVTVFTDLSGKKILERTAAGDTYYVYNDLGQLRFVLTPAFGEISRSRTMFAYEYRYDSRGRVVKKILPKDGTEGSVTEYWYDRADRVAYMKDPALGSRYRFYLYDQFGRLCVQGTCSNRYCQCGSRLAKVSYASGTGGVCQTGYAAPYTISDPQLEIVNYYDNYVFIGHHLTSAMPTVSINTNLEQYATGSLTGQVVYATGGEALGTVSVYDQKGQLVRSVRKGLGGLLEDVHTAYSFTGAWDTTRAEVGVGYGGSLVAETVYTYGKGKKTKMRVSVSHGRPAQSRETTYTYDAIGRLGGKARQLTGTGRSLCSYSYDVHGWLTSVVNGEFQECLYYADGLDGGCWNGNISTMKWRSDDNGFYKGYNLKYDGNNRLYSSAFGSGDNLTNNPNYFSEHVEYDSNGNITSLWRYGLTDNLHGGFGLVDNLHMTYEGNMLTSVRDSASHLPYSGATDFDGVSGQEYPLTYNASGSLVSDAGRGIARIDYDRLNNPVRIQFTDGSVTRYVYSAAGEKLRVTHLMAVPNITVAIGSARELSPSEILSADSTDYLLGGSLTLRNGRIDKYQFEEGYCQAAAYPGNASQDNITFCYYDRDHLGNIRQVINAFGSTKGTVIQRMDYYPFGAQFCDGSTASEVQSRKYNGKEFDNMHGLNTYDYGARQYNPVTARWDRVDPLCEKYYGVSPYAYCLGNPVRYIDPDGREIWVHYYDEDGQQQSFQYTAGMQCNVDNSTAQTIVENLNTMYTNESGAKVIDAIIGSITKYGFMQADTHSENGEGYLNPATNIASLNNVNNTLSFAEEAFHIYQSVNNQGGTTAVNEVEAKLFSAKMNYEIETWFKTAPYYNQLAGYPESPYQDSIAHVGAYSVS